MIPLNDPDIHRQTTPYVTYGFIALNVLIAAYQLTLTGLDEFVFTYRYGAIPFELTGLGELGLERIGVGTGIATVDLTTPVPTWATMFTSMFLHGGLLHLGGNMLFLWVFGDNVEDRFGHVRFLSFYLLAGVAAVWAQVLVSTDSVIPMVGASGAIAGVLGSYVLLFPHSRVHTLVVVGFIFHLRLRAIVLIGAWTAMQVFNGVGSLGVSSAGSGVAYFAHLGGFALGIAVTLLYLLVSRGRRGGPPSGRGGEERYWRGRPLD